MVFRDEEFKKHIFNIVWRSRELVKVSWQNWSMWSISYISWTVDDRIIIMIFTIGFWGTRNFNKIFSIFSDDTTKWVTYGQSAMSISWTVDDKIVILRSTYCMVLRNIRIQKTYFQYIIWGSRELGSQLRLLHKFDQLISICCEP